jgi:hypothetical protein
MFLKHTLTLTFHLWWFPSVSKRKGWGNSSKYATPFIRHPTTNIIQSYSYSQLLTLLLNILQINGIFTFVHLVVVQFISHTLRRVEWYVRCLCLCLCLCVLLISRASCCARELPLSSHTRPRYLSKDTDNTYKWLKMLRYELLIIHHRVIV